MIKDRRTAVLFTCGICNLNCRYCNIDKNPALLEIDKILEESFQGDYYFNRIKEYFPDKTQLRTIETWGGEPFMKMDRIYNLLHSVINYYPYFNNMYSSTNFSYDSWLDQFYGLMDQFGKYPERDFIYDLQLSCDGPEYINDFSRGLGVTKKCINNFNKLVDSLTERLASNIELRITLKPTLDKLSINELSTKDKIIEYYQFFEKTFIEPIRSLNLDNVEIYLPIPNTATPAPTTKEDGIQFARLCKNCREIEKEASKYFKYYEIITPYSKNGPCQNCLTYHCPDYTCGAGNSLVGFLPYNIIAICNEGFSQIIDQYKEYATKNNIEKNHTIAFDKFLNEQHCNLCMTDEQYKEFERCANYYTKSNTSARLVNLTSTIITLALAGQIDSKYVNQQNALHAAMFLQYHTAYCFKDNYNMSGSFTLNPLGRIKLLLNGAMEYIRNEKEMPLV